MQAIVFWLALSTLMLGYMSFWYGIARVTNRYDVVDCAWGIGFVFAAWMSLLLRGNFGDLQLVSAGFVSLWGVRLFGHIANRNWRKHEDDHRYQALRTKWGKDEYRKAYTNVFLLQGLLVILISTPMFSLAFSHSHHPNVLTYAGWVVWLFAIGYEAVADWQLATFISRRQKKSHAVMDQGLWRYSRHPNYFGEITVWWGAAIVSVSAGKWWGVLGAAAITILITKVSGIPPLEKHYDGNKAYETYRARTSVLLPLPVKRP